MDSVTSRTVATGAVAAEMLATDVANKFDAPHHYCRGFSHALIAEIASYMNSNTYIMWRRVSLFTGIFCAVTCVAVIVAPWLQCIQRRYMMRQYNLRARRLRKSTIHRMTSHRIGKECRAGANASPVADSQATVKADAVRLGGSSVSKREQAGDLAAVMQPLGQGPGLTDLGGHSTCSTTRGPVMNPLLSLANTIGMTSCAAGDRTTGREPSDSLRRARRRSSICEYSSIESSEASKTYEYLGHTYSNPLVEEHENSHSHGELDKTTEAKQLS